MEPIINPLWFYLIDTVTSLKVIFLIIGTMAWMALGVISVSHLSWDSDDFIDFWKLKYTKVIAVTATVLIIVGCLIPGIETSYKMLVASLVTPDNITAVGESVSSVVDYIINSVDKLIESK